MYGGFTYTHVLIDNHCEKRSCDIYSYIPSFLLFCPANEKKRKTLEEDMSSSGSINSNFIIRPARITDCEEVANIIEDSFNFFNAMVGLPPEFPPRSEHVDLPSQIAQEGVSHPRVESFVAVDEEGGYWVLVS